MRTLSHALTRTPTEAARTLLTDPTLGAGNFLQRAYAVNPAPDEPSATPASPLTRPRLVSAFPQSKRVDPGLEQQRPLRRHLRRRRGRRRSPVRQLHAAASHRGDYRTGLPHWSGCSSARAGPSPDNPATRSHPLIPTATDQRRGPGRSRRKCVVRHNALGRALTASRQVITDLISY